MVSSAALVLLAASVLALPEDRTRASASGPERAHTLSEHHGTHSNKLSTSSASSNATSSESSATASSRPWILDQARSVFVENAIDIRSKGVPASKASSVAAEIFDAAVQPPQYTSLAVDAAGMYFQNGDKPDPSQLYDFATKASSAYEDIHNELGYWSLVNYVHSEGTVFDKEHLKPTGEPVWQNNTSALSRLNAEQSRLTSIYSSLQAHPTGSMALETLSAVGSKYVHDFTFQDKPANSTDNNTSRSSMIESILMRLLSTF